MSTDHLSNNHLRRKSASAKRSLGTRCQREQDASLNNLRWSEDTVLEPAFAGVPDLVCFSHLRWDFVHQRPQHLLSRCAQTRRVFFVEKPLTSPDDSWWLNVSRRECGVWVAVPYLPKQLIEKSAVARQQLLLDNLCADAQIQAPILWYYTPMAVPFTHQLNASAVVYDCMDELSTFKGAPPELQLRETHLFKLADLVFTGGRSLYEAKQHQHANVYAFPSSIDAAHFAQARRSVAEPLDQAAIPHPRLGFYGVVDERMNLTLLDGIAKARPDWHLVIVGPVVKIEPSTLPRHPNIHYLGGKSYQELPNYLAGWDVALLPFVCNESTRFISPTKTPEYLAAGKPVVSTSIRDVVRPYGEQGLVQIADTVSEFVTVIAVALNQAQTNLDWLRQVDAFLGQTSWDSTWHAMNQLLETAITRRSLREGSTTKAQGTNQPVSIPVNVNKLAI